MLHLTAPQLPDQRRGAQFPHRRRYSTAHDGVTAICRSARLSAGFAMMVAAVGQGRSSWSRASTPWPQASARHP